MHPAVVVILTSVVSTFVTLFVVHLVITGRDDSLCDHLKVCWNVLSKYRLGMPREPQPLDQAMHHLYVAMKRLGVDESKTVTLSSPGD